MRPRVFPAEDHERRFEPTAHRVASMRPRVFPAEDGPSIEILSPIRLSFNEAAGIRGRPTSSTAIGPESTSFNEAAGIPAEDVIVINFSSHPR